MHLSFSAAMFSSGAEFQFKFTKSLFQLEKREIFSSLIIVCLWLQAGYNILLAMQNHKNRRYISGANLCSRRLVFSFTPTNKFDRWLRESNSLYISWPEILPFSRKFLVLLTNHIHLTKNKLRSIALTDSKPSIRIDGNSTILHRKLFSPSSTQSCKVITSQL